MQECHTQDINATAIVRDTMTEMKLTYCLQYRY